jgi:hypothetical protein
MVQLLQAYPELDRSLLLYRLVFLDQLDNTVLEFQKANQISRQAALKWAEFVDHPGELEGLRRVNVFMISGTDLIQKFVNNVADFHHGKPYWDRVGKNLHPPGSEIHWEELK